VQSCEQGWRRPGPLLEKMALLLYIAKLQGSHLGKERCWEVLHCAPEIRETCVAYRTRQGHLCWFLTGTPGYGQRMADWEQKRARCIECSFFQRLLTPPCEEPPDPKPHPRTAEHE
jgi:hypothetical protein